MEYTIYCDMDGVLTDFDNRFRYFAGVTPDVYEKENGTEEFWDLIDNKIGISFWTNMPWMPQGKKLWSYIKKYKPTILSAPSRNPSSRNGKKKWIQKNIPNAKLILAARQNKMQYSGENNILIDDRSDTIEEWKSKGGIGIIF
ncbi:MAG: hypothetical protein KC414_06735, partial [Romboutsia sp.]|nr:hypothetical protein [Romboutsia sp.]